MRRLVLSVITIIVMSTAINAQSKTTLKYQFENNLESLRDGDYEDVVNNIPDELLSELISSKGVNASIAEMRSFVVMLMHNAMDGMDFTSFTPFYGDINKLYNGTYVCKITTRAKMDGVRIEANTIAVSSNGLNWYFFEYASGQEEIIERVYPGVTRLLKPVVPKLF